MTETNEEKATGIVDTKYTKEGVTDGKAWIKYIVLMNDRTYSTFDENIYKQISVDKTYDIYYKTSGQYKNITRVEEISEKKIKEAVSGTTETKDVWAGKDLRMVKMNALTNANNLIANLVSLDPEMLKAIFNKGQKPIDLTMEIAKTFERWIRTDTDLE